ncbi:MAG: VanW family protein [Candidatus Doudnabacteria bacterium]|nr:VanW family protein [Candidatus Doudnabacteria bacterium]
MNEALRLKNSKYLLLAVFMFLIPKPAWAKTATFKDQSWQINPSAVTVSGSSVRNAGSLLGLAKEKITGSPSPVQQKIFSDSTLEAINQIALEINQKSEQAKLVLEGERTKEFSPGKDGQSLDTNKLSQLLLSGQDKFSLPVVTSSSSIKLSETNSLGINELVATGESNFKGSPKNRITNIRVGSAKFNGVIIRPGEEFSFNKFLGDVDAEHGFLPELVIKRTGVVPEFGGGLCQVSSTTFRAAMNAGLPIVERRAHSFAVQYYAPQGSDATIYPGVTDLRFTNNLNSSLLVWTRIEGTRLFFDFYGTKDDRIVEFDGPVQYDKKTDGSMKATWTRRVKLNGTTTEQVFRSTYLPPALFHPEEQATTPNPQTPSQ